jgi:hypothetical protein
MHAFVSGKARMAAPARTVLARAGSVWMWPGIALTETRGAASVPIVADVARFWISRLYGPQANDWAVPRCLAIAAQKLSEGDEAGAQQTLDASGLTRLSSDGAVLMRAVAGSLGIGPLDLPWADGPRLWARKTSKRMFLCSRTIRQRRHCSRRRGLGTSPNTCPCRPDLPIIKAGGSSMAKAALLPNAGKRCRTSAIMAGRRWASHQKFRRRTRSLKISASLC